MPKKTVNVHEAKTHLSRLLSRVERGDEIVTTDHEYNAVINTLHAVADPVGATVRLARIPLPITDEAAVVAAVASSSSSGSACMPG